MALHKQLCGISLMLIMQLKAFQGTSHDDFGTTERIPTTPPIIDGSVRLVGGQHPCEGRVEILSGNEWGTVCDDAWDLPDAEVVCRKVGCGEATDAWQEASFGPGIGTILMDNLKCSGEEASLEDCSHVSRDDHNCDHSEDAGVSCSVFQQDTPTSTTN